MASSIVVPIVRIEKVRSHPNADKLELCNVLGFQMCIPKGKHKSGDICVYVPADSLVPNDWAEKWGVLPYLKGQEKNRVGRVRLRGEPSFGLIVDMSWLPGSDKPYNVGDNVADCFGIKKYEHPVKAVSSDAAAYDSDIDPYVSRYTDIENGRVFTEVFREGEEVVATEKIHGTNCKVGFVRVGDEWIPVAGSMGVRRKRPMRPTWTPQSWLERLYVRLFGMKYVEADFDDREIRGSTYWSPFALPSVRVLLMRLCDCAERSVLLYGEVFGPCVQNLHYGVTAVEGFRFRAFDICIDGKFLNWVEFSDLCGEVGVPVVPVVYRGAFSFEDIKKAADGRSTLPGADNIREGVVVKPVVERVDSKVGRAVLKFIGTEYELSKKDEDDCKDV